jgi:hypothetical protein
MEDGGKEKGGGEGGLGEDEAGVAKYLTGIQECSPRGLCGG